MKASPAGRLFTAFVFGTLSCTAVLKVNALGQVPQTMAFQKSKDVPTADPPPPPVDKTSVPSKWKVILTGTGGELGGSVAITEVAVTDRKGQGLLSRTPASGKAEVIHVNLPEQALNRLWKVVADVDAMNLADFSRTEKDSPHYTIRLEVAGKTHTIRVQGYSQSEKHLKLILAIQKCFSEGVSP
jgi:hypothetical protein